MVYKKNLVKGKFYVEVFSPTDLRIIEFVKIIDVGGVPIPVFNIVTGQDQGRRTNADLSNTYRLNETRKHHVMVIIFREKFRLM